MSRWRMHRLGLVNFWYYDREEFIIDQGHFLIRGHNGSGKSVTTMSFIPFILDGDRRPERLDPFGSRDRKMEYYLLGDDKDDATAYLYLEFKKPDVEMYLTVGIGMRAVRGKNMDFWGFCLRDGRRIGYDGMDLVERVGDQLLPLSRLKMKNLLDSPEDWADSPGVYKQLVNERIFGFRDIRQFEQLVNLLIKVRANKLNSNKDSFKPTELIKLLNDSLQVLSDEDLSAMVSTMERMDELETEMKGFRDSLKDAESIKTELDRYNRYMLGTKGKAYLDSRSSTRQCRKKLRETEMLLEETHAFLEKLEEEAKDASQRLETAKAKRLALGEDDLNAKQEQLRESERACEEHNKRIQEETASLDAIEGTIRSGERKLLDQRQRVQDGMDGLTIGLRKLKKENEVLQLGDEHDEYVRDLPAQWENTETGRVKNALERRRKTIRITKDLLQKLETAKDAYEKACANADEAHQTQLQAASEHRAAEDEEHSQRDALLENFIRQADANVELKLPSDDIQEIHRAIVAYSSPSDWTPIRERIERQTSVAERDLSTIRIRLENQKDAAEQQEKALTQEIRRVENEPDHKPERDERTEEARAILQARGVPHAALYEVVDFAEDLDQDARNLLEAQLRDTGLLDALVVPESWWRQVQMIYQKYPDRFLRPGPKVSNPITGLVPDGDKLAPHYVMECLESISTTDLTASTALLPDGRYRNGVLEGRSVVRAGETASFVGAAARKAAKERLLQELRNQLAEVQEQVDQLEEQLKGILARIIQLHKERDEMPSPAGLDKALDVLHQAARALEEANRVLERLRAAENAAKQEVNRLNQESRDASFGMPYACTLEDYESAEESAESYGDIFRSLDDQQKDLRRAREAMEDNLIQLDQWRDQAAGRQRSLESIRGQLAVAENRAATLREFLDNPENRSRAQQIIELAREIEEQGERQKKAEVEHGKQEVIAANGEDSLKEAQVALAAAEEEEARMELYFREETELNYPSPDRNPNLEQFARAAWTRIRGSETAPQREGGPEKMWEKTPEQMNNSLRAKFESSHEHLNNYHPKVTLMFDPPDAPGLLRQRYIVQMQKTGRDMSLYDFVDALTSDIEATQMMLEERDRELFENILTETVSHKLRARIAESQQWTEDMTALMGSVDTSMGLTLKLEWKPKRAVSPEEMDTARLVELLNRDKALLRPEDIQMVARHFRSRVKEARDTAASNDILTNYGDLIRETLDYRTWYVFTLSYHRTGDTWRELTDKNFNQFSGGEKAMSMYLPLFASVSSQYKKANGECPMVLALDEAFAGVDEKNVGAMFELVNSLDLDYIMNSQSLWGCYEAVKNMDIAELQRPANAPFVTVLRYHWDGKNRVLLEDSQT